MAQDTNGNKPIWSLSESLACYVCSRSAAAYIKHDYLMSISATVFNMARQHRGFHKPAHAPMYFISSFTRAYQFVGRHNYTLQCILMSTENILNQKMTDCTFKQHYYVQDAHVVDFTPKPRVFRKPQTTTAVNTIQTEPLCCYQCHSD